MGRLVKFLLVLVLVGLASLSGYAYLGDLTPPQTETRQPVTLNAD